MLHLSTVDPETLTLLREILKLSFIREKFGLAGGTSLALQIGHRKSIDLDLFCSVPFQPTEIENLLVQSNQWHYEPMGKSERILFCTINNIKCDFIYEPFPLIKPLVHTDGTILYSIPDIAAMKMHTVCGRGKKKDFFDIYALLQLFSWKELLKWFELKYGESQLFFLWKSITYFTDAEEDVNIRGIDPFNVSWEEVKSEIISKCR